MPRLQESLSDQTRRSALISDCVTMIDDEVASKGGFSGLAIKAAYKVVKGVKPGFIPDAVDGLLNDFANNLQPLADDAAKQSTAVSKYFDSNRGRVADALLNITDERAKRSRHGVVKGAYEKLRPSAKRNVEDAAPRVGVLIEKYTK